MMNKSTLLIVFLCLSTFSFSQINVQWESRYNNVNGIDKVSDFELDAAGNSYVLGTSFDGSSFDVVTVKYDNTGTLLWTNTYGGSGLDEATALTLDNNGDVIITGARFIAGSDWDIFTNKINGNTGTTTWSTIYGGSNLYDIGHDVLVNSSNEIYVAGNYNSSPTDLDYVIIKYSTTGNQLNLQSNGGGSSDEGLFLGQDATGNIYLGGTREFSTSSTYFDFRVMKFTSDLATITWENFFDSGFSNIDKPNAMIVDASGNVYIGGQGFVSTVEKDDYLLMKINTSGVLQWNRMYSGDDGNTDKINAMVFDAGSNKIFVTGKSKSIATAEDYYTIAYDGAGTELWSQRYTGPGLGLDEASDITISSTGGLYVAGYSYLTTSNNDYYTIKYDLNGNELWATRFDGPAGNSDKALRMRTDNSENIYITGTSHGGSTNLDYSTIKYCQLETVASADVAICAGQSTILSASSVGNLGSGYTWAVVSGDPITASNFSCTVCASPTASPSVTTTYSVFSTSASGCVDYDTVTITVNSIPTPTIYNTTALDFCVGDSVELYTDTYNSYLWSNTETTINTYAYTAGNYSVTITDANSCQATANVTVTTYALPNVDAGLGQTICPENTAQLMASGASNYVWDVDATLSQLLIANPIANPTVNTTYTVTGTDGNGCSASDQVTISLFTSPTVDAGLPLTICVNDSTQLMATGAVTYLWNNTSSMPIQNINNPWVYPTTQTKYIVTGTDANNCIAKDSVTISTNSLPIVNAGVDQTFCQGDSVHIFATGALTYVWENSPFLSDLNSSNPWASPTTQTSFIVTGTDINNCVNNDTVVMFVNSTPNINAGIDTSVCIGSSIQLGASGAVSYLWTADPSLTPINVSNPTVNPTTPTTYTVQGTDANGCKGTDMVSVTINQLPTVDAGADTFICDGDSIQFNASGAVNYVWAFHPTLNQLIGNNPWAKPIIPTTYTVTGTDANGCSNTDQISVGINPNPLPPTLTQDGNLLISDSLTGNTWYLDGVLLTGETNDTLVYSSHANGVYTLVYTDPNGCGSASDAINANITIVDVGINENTSLLELNIYPNPTKDIVNIVANENIVNITITDLNGKIIFMDNNINQSQVTLNFTDFENGVYLIKIESDNNYNIKRLIKH